MALASLIAHQGRQVFEDHLLSSKEGKDLFACIIETKGRRSRHERGHLLPFGQLPAHWRLDRLSTPDGTNR